jgi:hypothetical protein
VSDLLAHCRKVSAQLDYELALRGKTLAKCTACAGRGHSDRGYAAHDAHGSYWVPAVDCRACGGRGRVEVPCSPDVEAAAVQRGREAAVKAITEYMAGKLRNRGEQLYLAEICELRDRIAAGEHVKEQP